ncbi:MAG: PilZ domain-containing protein [Halioglobus sp.]|nr:PilZ domain-containing protein [Halioglobus sp.]
MPEQRKYLRLPLECTTFIELLSPRLGQSESGKMVRCSTINVSRGGLQVILAEPLTVGAILQIGVDLPNWADTLYLAAEVRYCQPSNNAQQPWIAGFQILNANDSDVERWVALITVMEN